MRSMLMLLRHSHPHLPVHRHAMMWLHPRQRKRRDRRILALSQVLLVQSLVQLLMLLYSILVYLLGSTWSLALSRRWRLSPRFGACVGSDNEMNHILPLPGVPPCI